MIALRVMVRLPRYSRTVVSALEWSGAVHGVAACSLKWHCRLLKTKALVPIFPPSGACAESDALSPSYRGCEPMLVHLMATRAETEAQAAESKRVRLIFLRNVANKRAAFFFYQRNFVKGGASPTVMDDVIAMEYR